MTRVQRRLLILIVAVIVAGMDLFFGWSVVRETSFSPVESVSSVAQTTSTQATVVRVVDGDTIDVREDNSSSTIRVRLLGVNTPESVDPRRGVQCFGKEASTALSRFLTDQRVRLEADMQADDRDIYGRLLRNVIRSDGVDVNAWLVEQGYAQAYLSFPLRPERKRQLRQLQDTARREGRGLWSTSTCAGKF